MTKKNLSLNADNDGIFLLEPALKETIWGGNKLREKYGKNSEFANVAESWECSVHPQGLSKVASDKYSGMYLRDVLAEHPEYLGNKIKSVDDFPFLIKFIDAREKLSVQVHPDDEYAEKYENGAYGKTEMWYVVEAENDAELVYGFYNEITRRQLADGARNGDIEKYLNKVRTHPGDVFFIPAGTVHGIGAGNLIVEVQESSDLTYRLYDYNRVDKDGNKRALHISSALDVINYKKSSEIRKQMRALVYKKGYSREALCTCKYFCVEKINVKTEEFIEFFNSRKRCIVLVCVSGSGLLWSKKSKMITVCKGKSVFVTSQVEEFFVSGNITFLKVM